MVEVAQNPERDRQASVAAQASQSVEGLSIALLRLDDQCCVHPPLRTEVLSRVCPDAIGLESARGRLAVQSWAVATPRRDGPDDWDVPVLTRAVHERARHNHVVADCPVVSKLLCHSGLRTTSEVYPHLTLWMSRDASDRVDRLLGVG